MAERDAVAPVSRQGYEAMLRYLRSQVRGLEYELAGLLHELVGRYEEIRTLRARNVA